MEDVYFNPFVYDEEKIKEWCVKESQSWGGNLNVLMPEIPIDYDVAEEDCNFECDVINKTLNSYDKQNIERWHIKAHLYDTSTPNTRFCLMLYANDCYGNFSSRRYKFKDNERYLFAFPMGVKDGNTLGAPTFKVKNNGTQFPRIGSSRTFDLTTGEPTSSNPNTGESVTNIGSTSWSPFDPTLFPTGINVLYLTDTEKNLLLDALSVPNTYTVPWNAKRNWWQSGFAIPKSEGMMIWYKRIPSFIPIFDDIAQAKRYLETGDDSGRINPFETDPLNPPKKVVEDWETNYKLFVSAGATNGTTQFDVVAYNQDYIDSGKELAGKYKLTVDATTNYGEWLPIGAGTQSQFPQVRYTRTVGNVDLGLYFRFTDADETQKATEFLVYFEPSANKEIGYKLLTVDAFVDNIARPTTRVNIVDGYRYTCTATGETLDILYRAISSDDVKDDGYSSTDDTPSDDEGSDITLQVGSGLHTFVISDSQFDEINRKLWSTDWSQVFKSNTINPIQCVITCKSIPFSASPKSSADVIIANLDTGVTANYVNPVRSFEVATVSMPRYNKDFTDIENVSVKCYLPYIGWVELPASEVMSREPYGRFGIAGVPKVLKFKYVVDFVDGNVRCIISVGDGVHYTERWYFDGNCAIDVAVTSDNHTRAIGESIKSAGATLMSIGSAIASGMSGNPAGVVAGGVSAISNAPNIAPSYSYSASCSPSGYINASMSTNIVLVFERPNVQMPSNFAHSYGRPCERTLTLGSLSGFTKCRNVQLSGINGTPNELAMIKSYLENGVIL